MKLETKPIQQHLAVLWVARKWAGGRSRNYHDNSSGNNPSSLPNSLMLGLVTVKLMRDSRRFFRAFHAFPAVVSELLCLEDARIRFSAGFSAFYPYRFSAHYGQRSREAMLGKGLRRPPSPLPPSSRVDLFLCPPFGST